MLNRRRPYKTDALTKLSYGPITQAARKFVYKIIAGQGYSPSYFLRSVNPVKLCGVIRIEGCCKSSLRLPGWEPWFSTKNLQAQLLFSGRSSPNNSEPSTAKPLLKAFIFLCLSPCRKNSPIIADVTAKGEGAGYASAASALLFRYSMNAS